MKVSWKRQRWRWYSHSLRFRENSIYLYRTELIPANSSPEQFVWCLSKLRCKRHGLNSPAPCCRCGTSRKMEAIAAIYSKPWDSIKDICMKYTPHSPHPCCSLPITVNLKLCPQTYNCSELWHSSFPDLLVCLLHQTTVYLSKVFPITFQLSHLLISNNRKPAFVHWLKAS